MGYSGQSSIINHPHLLPLLSISSRLFFVSHSFCELAWKLSFIARFYKKSTLMQIMMACCCFRSVSHFSL
eukprot:c48096_g1_i1 orf=377-586(+)